MSLLKIRCQYPDVYRIWKRLQGISENCPGGANHPSRLRRLRIFSPRRKSVLLFDIHSNGAFDDSLTSPQRSRCLTLLCFLKPLVTSQKRPVLAKLSNTSFDCLIDKHCIFRLVRFGSVLQVCLSLQQLTCCDPYLVARRYRFTCLV